MPERFWHDMHKKYSHLKVGGNSLNPWSIIISPSTSLSYENDKMVETWDGVYAHNHYSGAIKCCSTEIEMDSFFSEQDLLMQEAIRGFEIVRIEHKPNAIPSSHSHWFVKIKSRGEEKVFLASRSMNGCWHVTCQEDNVFLQIAAKYFTNEIGEFIEKDREKIVREVVEDMKIWVG